MSLKRDLKLTIERIVYDSLRFKKYPLRRMNLYSSNQSLLLLFAYSRLCDQSLVSADQLASCLNDFTEGINQIEVADATLGSGLSGIGWLIQNLCNAGLIDGSDYDETLQDIDSLVFKSIAFDIKTANYDLFMGLLGKGVFFLERYKGSCNEKHLDFLNQIIASLYAFSTEEEGIINWRGKLQLEDNSRDFQEAVILGLAHGLPSILGFLAKVFEINPSVQLKDKMVNLIERIETYGRPGPDGITWYPHYIYDSTDYPLHFNKRLAWCYGDLGLTYMLLSCSIVLENNVLVNKYTKQLQQLSTYKDRQESQVFDAGFCHGAAGVAHLFYKAFTKTSNPVFEDAAEHWYGQVLSFSCFTDSLLAGFKTHRLKNDKPQYTNDPSLIYGTSGTGLSLLSYLYKEDRWDSCFHL
jgi:lantibiotic biosynthesis protein